MTQQAEADFDVMPLRGVQCAFNEAQLGVLEAWPDVGQGRAVSTWKVSTRWICALICNQLEESGTFVVAASHRLCRQRNLRIPCSDGHGLAEVSSLLLDEASRGRLRSTPLCR